jgi:hypothetical protein
MKKIVIIIQLLFLSFITGIAQNKNVFLVGGDIGAMFSSSKINDLEITDYSSSAGGFYPSSLLGTIGDNSGNYKILYLNLSPSISYFISSKLLIGIGVDLLNVNTKYESELITRTNLTSFLLTPNVRYYIYNGFFGQIQYNFGESWDKIFSKEVHIPATNGFSSIDYTTTMQSTTKGFGISAGYSIPLGNNLITDIAIKYYLNTNKAEYDYTGGNGTYSEKQNMILLSIGLKYLLKKKE